MKTLTIKLTAPLQSYGNEATFGRRTSYLYPTKSAIVGMIAAALGYERNDQRILNLNKLAFAVRVDQLGQTMKDFQIVEYAKSLTKKAKKLTYRDYIQDAVFVAAIGSDNIEIIDKIYYALFHPKFALFLGRRSNPPAGLLKLQQFADQDPLTVLKSLDWQASDWYQAKYPDFQAEIIYDKNLGSEDQFVFQLKDQVGSFDQKDRYHNYREVVSTHVLLKKDDKSPVETKHDVMANI